LFLLQTTPEVFFGSSSGLTFSIRDYDVVNKNDILGKVVVNQEDLLKGTGERIEYKLQLDKAHKKAKDARLVLRYRHATPADLEFMRIFAAQKKKDIVGAYAKEAYVPIRSHPAGLLKRESRKTKNGDRQFRVKPEPDPDRPEQTKWMTEAEINSEAYKPSKNWIEVGSGGAGALYFELIGCDGLPNMDTGPIDGKTDAFACIIYEDSIVNTDCINDTLRPRWLPWAQRAFKFNILHPSSQLYIGLFDFDSATSLDAHDPIGRVGIDVTNFRPSTEYTMTFDLYTSALVTKRKSKGSVTVRIRVEWANERKALLTSLSIPPDIYINVGNKKEFLCSHYTTMGKVREREMISCLLTHPMLIIHVLLSSPVSTM
jgi:Ca2+-dependent lipid-binding protein